MAPNEGPTEEPTVDDLPDLVPFEGEREEAKAALSAERKSPRNVHDVDAVENYCVQNPEHLGMQLDLLRVEMKRLRERYKLQIRGEEQWLASAKLAVEKGSPPPSRPRRSDFLPYHDIITRLVRLARMEDRLAAAKERLKTPRKEVVRDW